MVGALKTIHRATRATIALGLGLLATSPAFALDNDPALHRLCTGTPNDASSPCGSAPQPDQAAFRKVVREYGMAFAPRLLAPAETTGINGFQFDLAMGITNINDSESYWTRTVDDETPPPVLLTTTLGLVKGLPYSVDVGANITYLFESEMLAFGGMVKWSVNEAVEAFPVDFALRGAMNRVVGSSDLDLTTASLDLILSRSFGVGGVANIAPYMAYEPVWAIGRSGVLDSTPRTPDDPGKSFVLAEESEVIHRFVLGTRFIVASANFTPEVVLTKGLQQYNIKLGLDF